MVFLIAPDAETQAPQIRNGDFDVHSLLKEMSLVRPSAVHFVAYIDCSDYVDQKEKATLLAGRVCAMTRVPIHTLMVRSRCSRPPRFQARAYPLWWSVTARQPVVDHGECHVDVFY
jgi:hypothetical protein